MPDPVALVAFCCAGGAWAWKRHPVNVISLVEIAGGWCRSSIAALGKRKGDSDQRDQTAESAVRKRLATGSVAR
ncbi:MAG: hypothetical protein CBB71_15705 [Rhodopirellula sp. TMED11]|nr:MAG: hypothetical protein CBB71_15705 [Rhodopirellula sp. TMED11]